MKRPDGLNKARAEHCTSQREDCECCECTSFNVGADAMYEELMKYRVKMPADFTPILIVIPSEEVKE